VGIGREFSENRVRENRVRIGWEFGGNKNWWELGGNLVRIQWELGGNRVRIG
jgi:hypothetical protein